MNENAPMEKSKMQKVYEGRSSSEIGDRISNLPDNIIHYILSLLPTIYAVGTSVLSTRWKYLWTGIHNLDFCEQLPYSKSRAKISMLKRKLIFIDFVDRVLPLVVVSNIHRFRLVCSEFDAAHIVRWITSAKMCNVEELVLIISLKRLDIFPLCLFISESLKVLEIGSEQCRNSVVSISIPSSFCFASLKVLHLNYTNFTVDQWVQNQKFSLSCPTLEEFIIKDCTWLGINNIDISAPKLQVLTIIDDRWDRTRPDCEIKISTQSLMSLHIRSSLPYKYSLCNMSPAVDAFVHLSYFDETVQLVGSLLRGLFSLKNLQLAGDSIRILSHPDVSAHMLSLSSLIHLSVKMHGQRIGLIRPSGRQFIDFLCNLPNVESISFPEGTESLEFRGRGHGRIIGRIPPCFLSHLKLVDIKCFSWCKPEMWFVKFLMKSARVVDKLTVKVTGGRPFSCRDITELQKVAGESNCVFEWRILGQCSQVTKRRAPRCA